MLIVVIIFATLIGVAWGAVLLSPFWSGMKRSLDRSGAYTLMEEASEKPTKAELVFKVAVISGIVSLIVGLACLAVLSINDPVTIFFLSWAAVGLLVWAFFGRKY